MYKRFDNADYEIDDKKLTLPINRIRKLIGDAYEIGNHSQSGFWSVCHDLALGLSATQIPTVFKALIHWDSWKYFISKSWVCILFLIFAIITYFIKGSSTNMINGRKKAVKKLESQLVSEARKCK